MKYAVVSHSGKQYKVAEGEVIELDLMADLKPQDSYSFEQVLLFVDGDTKKVGTPTVSGATVKGSIVEHKKGDKIRVAKFKAKARYRKVIGHRSKLTAVKIESIKA
jgi:large subunit ribosomal protein L21